MRGWWRVAAALSILGAVLRTRNRYTTPALASLLALGLFALTDNPLDYYYQLTGYVAVICTLAVLEGGGAAGAPPSGEPSGATPPA